MESIVTRGFFLTGNTNLLIISYNVYVSVMLHENKLQFKKANASTGKPI